jgi:hypothetical protein
MLVRHVRIDCDAAGILVRRDEQVNGIGAVWAGSALPNAREGTRDSDRTPTLADPMAAQVGTEWCGVDPA